MTGTWGGFYDVDNGREGTRTFSCSRRRFLNRTSTLVSVLCAFGVVPAWPQVQPAAQGGPAKSAYLDPASVPAPARGYLLALGNRLQVIGKERTILVGAFADATGSNPAQVIWQAPGWVRFDQTNKPPLAYDDVVGLQNAGSLSASDTDVLESLLDDSPQSFLYGFRRSTAYRFLGSRFRTDDGKTPNYQGPWYDIYAVLGPALAKPGAPPREKFYYFDSVTGLLWKTVYVLPGGVRVSTEYTNWTRSASDDPFPGQIVRKENGSAIFTFTVTSAAVAPEAHDGVFPGH